MFHLEKTEDEEEETDGEDEKTDEVEDLDHVHLKDVVVTEEVAIDHTEPNTPCWLKISRPESAGPI